MDLILLPLNPNSYPASVNPAAGREPVTVDDETRFSRRSEPVILGHGNPVRDPIPQDGQEADRTDTEPGELIDVVTQHIGQFVSEQPLGDRFKHTQKGSRSGDSDSYHTTHPLGTGTG